MTGAREAPDDRPETYFSSLAHVYAAHRPGYPVAVADTALRGLPVPARVVDVGCGTGISARLFATAGARVVGIDPNPEMLERAAAVAGPSVVYRRAPAERTGLAEESADLVCCAQSFHWFDADAALREFRRILAPGGRLALLWNIRTVGTPLGAGYADLVRRAHADARARGRRLGAEHDYRLAACPLFANVRTIDFENPQRLDWPGLLGRVRSASYFPTRDPLRSELETALRALYEAHHDADRCVTLPQRASLTLGDRRT